MRKLCKLLTVSSIMIMALGCASGPKFSEIQSSMSTLSPDFGRIFIYRKTSVGAAIQPKVFINDEEAGKAVPKGFFYVDKAPGNYEIKTSTEVKRTLSLTLDKGQTRYVRLNVGIGFFVGHIYPELVDNEVGVSEINKMHYIGATSKE